MMEAKTDSERRAGNDYREHEECSVELGVKPLSEEDFRTLSILREHIWPMCGNSAAGGHEKKMLAED